MKRLTPFDYLPVGTVVRVRGEWRGTVAKAEVAHNGVVVHTVKLTERYKRTLGIAGRWCAAIRA